MYKCQLCNVEYKSRMGLYNHRMKYHPPEPKDKIYMCVYCKKEFNHKQNKWRHQQICKQRDTTTDIKTMRTEIAYLKQEIKELKSKPSTNISQTINNISGNTINNISGSSISNTITMVIPFGKEPINCLPEQEVTKTLEEYGIDAITELCKIKHFNPEKPELHNFCVTAKNDPYAIIVDPETKRIKSVNKKEIFDKAYYGLVMNIDSIQTQKQIVNETKNKIKAISMSRNILKSVRNAINEEAYHYKDMVQNTWKNAKFGIVENINIHKNINYKKKTRDEIINELSELLEDVKSSLEINL